jgi:Peptidase inhibitor family I36
MSSTSVSRRGTTRGAARRRAGVLAVAVLGAAALLVPAGSASGVTPGPSVTAVSSSDPVAAPTRAGQLENDITQVLRSSPGAVRTGPYEVSWDDGAVVSTWVPRGSAVDGRTSAEQMRLPDGGSDSAALSAASSYAGCPDGTSVHWFCFYENASYGGRMLQFRDCPSTQSLGAYGFANATTSWVNNRSGVTITVYDGSTSGTVLWREYGRSHSSNVGSWANDRADTFTCRT